MLTPILILIPRLQPSFPPLLLYVSLLINISAAGCQIKASNLRVCADEWIWGVTGISMNSKELQTIQRNFNGLKMQCLHFLFFWKQLHHKQLKFLCNSLIFFETLWVSLKCMHFIKLLHRRSLILLLLAARSRPAMSECAQMKEFEEIQEFQGISNTFKEVQRNFNGLKMKCLYFLCFGNTCTPNHWNSFEVHWNSLKLVEIPTFH